MNVLVTGANGLLGQNLVRGLLRKNHRVTAVGRGPSRLAVERTELLKYIQIDLTQDTAGFEEDLLRSNPDAIVHAAAMTQVDQCELERDLCYQTNVKGTATILRIAEQCHCHFIYISTDFVFDGRKGNYVEEDYLGSVNWYGSTKILAEQMVCASKIKTSILRTCLVYGATSLGSRANIITWVKSKLERNESIQVVDDQIRTPTYVADLCQGIGLVLESGASGVYHISGKDTLTPFEMAIMTARFLRLDKSLIERVDATTFTQLAKRPIKTGLVIEKARTRLEFDPLNFDDGLRQMLKGEKKY
jgi:dTDP-4-dehydrorhamnose reductase